MQFEWALCLGFIVTKGFTVFTEINTKILLAFVELEMQKKPLEQIISNVNNYKLEWGIMQIFFVLIFNVISYFIFIFK